MNQPHKQHLLARVALLLSISLTAACTAVTPPPVAEQAVPQGVGFEAEVLGSPAAPTAATPATAPLPLPSEEPAPAATPPPAASRIKRQHRYVNVRPDPSSERKPVAVLMGGKRVEVVGEQENWVKIRWQRGKKELEGWVFKRFVEGHE